MRRIQNKVEKLDGRFPGVLSKVRVWFDQGYTTKQVSEFLVRDYHVHISPRTVGNHRCRRWSIQKSRVDDKAETTLAMNKAIGEDQLDARAKARLWDLMDELNPQQLLALRLYFLRFKNQDLKEKEFLLKSGELQAVLQAGAQEEPGSDAVTMQVVEKIREIFGIGPSQEIPPPDAPDKTGDPAAAPAGDRMIDTAADQAAEPA